MPSALPTRPPVAGAPERSRRRALLGLAVLALLMHAAFLGGVGGAAADLPPTVAAGAQIDVRLVEPDAQDEPVAQAEPETPVPAPVVAAPRRVRATSTVRESRAVSLASAASAVAIDDAPAALPASPSASEPTTRDSGGLDAKVVGGNGSR